jgi:hypothetical protein
VCILLVLLTHTFILYRTGETKLSVRIRIFRYFRGSPERLILPSSYLSVRTSVCLSVYLYQCYHHRTDFCEIWYWKLIMKIGWEIPNLFKIGKSYQAPYVKTWVCIVFLAATYVAQQYREHIGVLLWQNLRCLLLWLPLRDKYLNNKQGRHFCVSTAKTLKRMYRNITLYYTCASPVFFSCSSAVGSVSKHLHWEPLYKLFQLELQTSLDAFHKNSTILWNYFIWILNFINICVMWYICMHSSQYSVNVTVQYIS